MKKIVVDACSLIYIAKISLKELIIKVFSEILIPSTVKREILSDQKRFLESKILKENIDSKKITEKNIQATRITKNLGLGESEAINLANNEKSLLITDDILAINQALSWGIKVKTTELLMLYLLKNKLLEYKIFEEKIYKLNEIKTLKPKVFEIILKEAEKFK